MKNIDISATFWGFDLTYEELKHQTPKFRHGPGLVLILPMRN